LSNPFWIIFFLLSLLFAHFNKYFEVNKIFKQFSQVISINIIILKLKVGQGWKRTWNLLVIFINFFAAYSGSTILCKSQVFKLNKRCHDTHCNRIKYNDTQHNSIQYNDALHNGIQYNDTQQKVIWHNNK